MRANRPAMQLLATLAVLAVTSNPANGQFLPPPLGPGVPPGDVNGESDLPAGAFRRLGTTAYRMGQSLRSAQFTPDGKHVILASSSAVYLFDAYTGKQVRRLSPGYISYRHLAISPDGKRLAFSQYGNYIQLMDVGTGRMVRRLQSADSKNRFRFVAFSPDGKKVIACPEDYYVSPGAKVERSVYVWNAEDGRVLLEVTPAHQSQIRAAFSADGKLFATFGGVNSGRPEDRQLSSAIQVWDANTGKELYKLRGNRGRVQAVAFSNDGKFLAALSGSAILNLWDLKSKKVLKRFAGIGGQSGGGFESFVAFSPDGRYLVSGGGGNRVLLWDTKTWKRSDQPAPQCRCTDAVFTKEGHVLAVGINGQAAVVWDVRTGKTLVADDGHSYPVRSVAFHPSGKRIVSVDQRGRLLTWEIDSGRTVDEVTLPNIEDASYISDYSYYSLALSQDARFLAAPFNQATRLWDLKSKEVLCDFAGSVSSSSVNHVGFSPDGSLVVILNQDASVSVWDVASGEEICNLPMLKKPRRVSFSSADVAISHRQGTVAATCYFYDNAANVSRGLLCVWDFKTGAELLRSENVGSYATLAFSNDGRYLAVGTSARLILYDAERAIGLRQFAGNFGRLQCLAFSPDGRTLAGVTHMYPSSGSMASPTIYVWETATGNVRTVFRNGHVGPVFALRYSPDGAMLASAGYDTSVVLWDLAGRQQKLAAKPDAGEEQQLWESLKSDNAASAFNVMRRLIVSPEFALRLVEKHVKPADAPTVDQGTIERLIKELDHPRYAVRAKALLRLKEIGRLALPELRKTLENPPSEEVRLQVARLIDRLETDRPNPEQLRLIRAVEILERIGTPQSRAALDRLARGAPGHILTEHARAALQRLSKR